MLVGLGLRRRGNPRSPSRRINRLVGEQLGEVGVTDCRLLASGASGNQRPLK